MLGAGCALFAGPLGGAWEVRWSTLQLARVDVL